MAFTLTDMNILMTKPDHFYGARPGQLERQIRNELSDHIIPSTQDDLPIAPNFFLEAKGPDGSLAVATRQACYDSELGARVRTPTGSIYHGGTLKLYTTHLTESEGPGRRPEYIMTQLKGWSMTSDLETFGREHLHTKTLRTGQREKGTNLLGLQMKHTQRLNLSFSMLHLSARWLPKQPLP
ncbi:hypothetical protein PAAG_06914 [Paracoccidioides lutzii Pb01]|uniref:Uncharacterized protein n=1 Tax=Paracoccidioides lutzii (strain ATCC MYA-826 / Pb01) TaxID=502779 RepID=C1H8B8_PARBA|nr:hypothetical protein PAAG_06914 [Paracoccidioides lutzii Pb01]EEH36496.2 hypothetical protein PAAG_06914 [Paracoccidioides lutzii Pb01]